MTRDNKAQTIIEAAQEFGLLDRVSVSNEDLKTLCRIREKLFDYYEIKKYDHKPERTLLT